MNNKMIKIIGFAATAVGMAATVVSSWVGEKNLDNKITEKVSEAISKSVTKED